MIYKILISGLFLYFIININNYKKKSIVKTKYTIDVGNNIIIHLEGTKKKIKCDEFIEILKII